jgi:hypothetical protein
LLQVEQAGADAARSGLADPVSVEAVDTSGELSKPFHKSFPKTQKARTPKIALQVRALVFVSCVLPKRDARLTKGLL